MCIFIVEETWELTNTECICPFQVHKREYVHGSVVSRVTEVDAWKLSCLD